jgi:Asp/Glu/hydantoin racemase
LRETLPDRQPVVGVFEASLMHAGQLGGKFAIISGLLTFAKVLC